LIFLLFLFEFFFRYHGTHGLRKPVEKCKDWKKKHHWLFKECTDIIIIFPVLNVSSTHGFAWTHIKARSTKLKKILTILNQCRLPKYFDLGINFNIGGGQDTMGSKIKFLGYYRILFACSRIDMEGLAYARPNFFTVIKVGNRLE